MKIAIIAPASVNHTVKVANELSRRGHKVHLLSLKNHKEGKDKLDERIRAYYSSNRSPFGYFLDFLYQ